MLKFTVITNRGAQLGVFLSRAEANILADEINSNGGEVFAWVNEDNNAVEEDIPGRGFIYG